MWIAVGAVLVGLAVMAYTFHRLRQEAGEEEALDDLLGMAPFSLDEDPSPEQLSAVTGRAVALADQAAERIGQNRSLGVALERAQIALRPGEFLIILAAAALGVAALILVLTHSKPFAALGMVGSVVVAFQVLHRRASKRKRAFEAQLPDALALVASSLSAGHTFLRAIQMMCEESSPPLSEEFGRVVAETRLGDPTVDALGRMSVRLQLRDMDMVVQAIRIQQAVGGKLADLLYTLAEFIRARDEVRREVKVLTAEGRMSAYVLAGLVPFLFVVIRVVNPTYIEPLYAGSGLAILAYCAVSVVIGMFVILRMVKIEI